MGGKDAWGRAYCLLNAGDCKASVAKSTSSA